MYEAIKTMFDKTVFLFKDLEIKNQVLSTRVNILQSKVDGLNPTNYPNITEILSRLSILEQKETTRKNLENKLDMDLDISANKLQEIIDDYTVGDDVLEE